MLLSKYFRNASLLYLPNQNLFQIIQGCECAILELSVFYYTF